MGNDQAYLLVTYKRYFMSTEMMMLKSNMSLNTPGMDDFLTSTIGQFKTKACQINNVTTPATTQWHKLGVKTNIIEQIICVLVTARDGKHPVTVSDTLSCHPSHLIGDGDKLFGVTNSKVRDLMNPGHFALLLHYLKKAPIFSVPSAYLSVQYAERSPPISHTRWQ